MKEFAEHFVPHLAPLIELYGENRPIFDVYGIDDEIDRALNRKVPLKSGGHVVFDQTEAMTTIDVNTGAYVGHRNLEETIFRTNLEAAAAIARQLRLRNLGGIIIIDFIDMDGGGAPPPGAAGARRTGSRATTRRRQIMNVSPLGLVEMTRKRNRESLEHRALPAVSKLRRPRLREDRRKPSATRSFARSCASTGSSTSRSCSCSRVRA